MCVCARARARACACRGLRRAAFLCNAAFRSSVSGSPGAQEVSHRQGFAALRGLSCWVQRLEGPAFAQRWPVRRCRLLNMSTVLTITSPPLGISLQRPLLCSVHVYGTFKRMLQRASARLQYLQRYRQAPNSPKILGFTRSPSIAAQPKPKPKTGPNRAQRAPKSTQILGEPELAGLEGRRCSLALGAGIVTLRLAASGCRGAEWIWSLLRGSLPREIGAIRAIRGHQTDY